MILIAGTESVGAILNQRVSLKVVRGTTSRDRLHGLEDQKREEMALLVCEVHFATASDSDGHNVRRLFYLPI